MISTLHVNIPERLWETISSAPMDGRIIFIRDGRHHVDLARWSNGEWSSELGICDEPDYWARLSIADMMNDGGNDGNKERSN